MYKGSQSKPSEYNDLNKVKLIHGGKEYFDLLLSLIERAKESIHLQTYIYDDDETGRRIADALKEAVKRKVSVFLLADGYASQAMSKAFIKDMVAAGIQFRFFEPFFKGKHFYFGRRMHHKIVVVDTLYALVGGINISNRYNDLPEKKAWLDFAIFIEGVVAKELCILCWKTWNEFPVNMGLTPCEEQVLTYTIAPEERMLVRMKRNDWVRGKNEISASYIEMFRNARSHIIIMCSYFLPGKIIRRLLRNATRRGVKVSVITAGKSDIRMAKYAERWMYDWLLRNNIELYEYQPCILHAKVAVCDGAWLTLGSYNVNNISAYASIELNLDIKNAAFANDMDNILQKIIGEDCIHITKEKHISTKNLVKQFIRWCSYHFIRTVFFLLTFYFKQRRN